MKRHISQSGYTGSEFDLAFLHGSGQRACLHAAVVDDERQMYRCGRFLHGRRRERLPLHKILHASVAPRQKSKPPKRE